MLLHDLGSIILAHAETDYKENGHSQQSGGKVEDAYSIGHEQVERDSEHGHDRDLQLFIRQRILGLR